MVLNLAYGKAGLSLEIPDEWNMTVLEPGFCPGVESPDKVLAEALQQPTGCVPLSQFIKPGEKVGIIFSDNTRPVPTRVILEAILADLSHINRADICLFDALGTHRRNTAEELREMLGDVFAKQFPIVQNDTENRETQVCLGESSFGHEIWLNRDLVTCDVVILTGFIEPHFFAGFSGGGKAVMPGMAGLTTILENHNARMIAHPKSTWGTTQGNPIWEEIQEIAHCLPRTFLVNVSLNKHKQITGVFAGDLDQAYAQGCQFVQQTAMAPVNEPFDIVITTNSGYPLDRNLYQSVKGMSAASRIIREGGSIILAAECRDGIPDGQYAYLLKGASSPEALLEAIHAPGYLKRDQWQAQIQAQIQQHADVYVYSEYLSDQQIHQALLKPCRNIPETVSALLRKYGKNARIGVLPEGPQTIPCLQPP